MGKNLSRQQACPQGQLAQSKGTPDVAGSKGEVVAGLHRFRSAPENGHRRRARQVCDVPKPRHDSEKPVASAKANPRRKQLAYHGSKFRSTSRIMAVIPTRTPASSRMAMSAASSITRVRSRRSLDVEHVVGPVVKHASCHDAGSCSSGWYAPLPER